MLNDNVAVIEPQRKRRLTCTVAAKFACQHVSVVHTATRVWNGCKDTRI